MIVASDQRMVLGGVSFQYASDVLDGLATMRASQYETGLLHIAVWDGLPGDGPGGTYDSVLRWRVRGREVHVISPQEIPAEPSTPVHAMPASPTVADSESMRTVAGVVPEIRAMIFADLEHFSRLSERQIPGFLREFIGPVAALTRQPFPAPEFRTHGEMVCSLSSRGQAMPLGLR